MSEVIKGLLFAWNKNKVYGQKLVADLTEEQMAAQPGPGMNHPAWVLSHLNAYLPVIHSIIKDESFEDPKNATFGMLSKPEADRSIYASKDELVSAFVDGHETIEAALSAVGDEVFNQVISLERWAKMLPTAGVALPYLMVLHENVHMGQLSAWRRVQGLPSV